MAKTTPIAMPTEAKFVVNHRTRFQARASGAVARGAAARDAMPMPNRSVPIEASEVFTPG